MGKNKQSKHCDELSRDTVLNLLSIYEMEWEHRDNTMWNVINALFYATIVCDIVPFIKDTYNFNELGFLILIFPLIGIVMSVFFLVVAHSFAKRLDSVRTIIDKIISMQFPKKFVRDDWSKSSSVSSKIEQSKTSIWLPAIMFLALFATSLMSFNVLLFLCFGNMVVGTNTLTFSVPISIIVFLASAIFVFLSFRSQK